MLSFVAVFSARPVCRLFFPFVPAVFFRRTRPGGLVFVRKGRMLRIQATWQRGDQTKGDRERVGEERGGREGPLSPA